MLIWGCYCADIIKDFLSGKGKRQSFIFTHIESNGSIFDKRGCH